MNVIRNLWERWKGIDAPAATDTLGLPPGLQPAQPALKQEQFADNHAVIRQQQERTRTLYRQVVAQNNRAVTRDLGSHVVDESRPLKPEFAASKPMVELDWTEVEAHGIVRIDVRMKR